MVGEEPTSDATFDKVLCICEEAVGEPHAVNYAGNL